MNKTNNWQSLIDRSLVCGSCTLEWSTVAAQVANEYIPSKTDLSLLGVEKVEIYSLSPEHKVRQVNLFRRNNYLAVRIMQRTDTEVLEKPAKSFAVDGSYNLLTTSIRIF